MSKSDTQTEKLIVGDVAVKPDGEKLQKVLARTGLGSRRKLEESIQAGDITVNSKTAKPVSYTHLTLPTKSTV